MTQINPSTLCFRSPNTHTHAIRAVRHQKLHIALLVSRNTANTQRSRITHTYRTFARIKGLFVALKMCAGLQRNETHCSSVRGLSATIVRTVSAVSVMAGSATQHQSSSCDPVVPVSVCVCTGGTDISKVQLKWI
jgi:hypothetical protein